MSDIINTELRQYDQEPVIVHLTTGEKVFGTLVQYHDEDYSLTLVGDGPPDNLTEEIVNGQNTFPAGQTTIIGNKIVRISPWDKSTITEKANTR